MTIQHLVAFNLALVAAMASPGPALLVAIRTTLSAGRKAGIRLGCGLGLMASTWTMAALLGLEVVFRLFPWAYVLTKTLGAVYLVYIAYKTWRGAHERASAGDKSIRRAFLQGLLINLLNPKSVLFAAAVLVVVFPQDMSAAENLIVVANHLLMELAFYTTVAFCLSSKVVSTRYLRAKALIDRAASVVLATLGLRLLFSR